MASEFKSDQSAGENLARLARKRLGKAIDTLARPADGDLAGAVHGARKHLKKMRALLRLARPGLEGNVFRRENLCLRDAGRTLSPLRDAQVLSTAFETLLTASGGGPLPSAAGIERIRQRLAEDARATAAEADLPHAVPETMAALERVRERLDQTPPPGGGWRLVGEGLETAYRDGRRAMRHAAAAREAGEEDEEDFHEWRKQIKHLACQLRLLRPLWRRVFKTMTRKLDALAEQLGDEHDLSVLRAKLLDSPDLGASADDLRAVRALIDARRELLRAESLEAGRRFYLEKPARFRRRMAAYWHAWRS